MFPSLCIGDTHWTVLELYIYYRGGISIKPAGDMDKMRGDMGGAACVVGTMLALSLIKTNTYVHGEFCVMYLCTRKGCTYSI